MPTVRRTHEPLITATRRYTAALLAIGLTVFASCGDEDADTDTGTDANADESSEASTDGDPSTGDGDGEASTGDGDGDGDGDLAPTEEDFICLLEWTKVRNYYLTNLQGDLDASLAVANSPDGGIFPPGTLIQLIPTEAMVKRGAGFSPATNDWEFFSLEVSDQGTTILDRGTTDVVNQFNGNCLDCHEKAMPQWDFVCEKDHGCDPLPLTDEIIESVQQGDPRCN